MKILFFPLTVSKTSSLQDVVCAIVSLVQKQKTLNFIYLANFIYILTLAVCWKICVFALLICIALPVAHCVRNQRY